MLKWWRSLRGIRSPDQLVKRDRQSRFGGLLDRQLIAASPDILDERMTGDDHPDAVVPLEAARLCCV
jgi:hypothetical protein